MTRPFRQFGTGGCTKALRWALWTVGLAVGSVIMVACGGGSRSAAAAAPHQSAPVRTDAEIRELDIIYYTQRAERDPTGAMDPAHLGALYLARGRETGDPRDALLAEAAARRSLRNRASHNTGAANVLQAALLAQHRFAEALQLAQMARDGGPENAGLRAAVGEIQMELGQYDSARVAFNGLHYTAGDLAVLPRVARWAEIEGDTAKARRLLHTALTTALKEPSLPREQVAWYWLRVGDVELRTGHATAADSAYRAGLAVHTGDYRLLSALAHSALVQQRWKDALRYGEEAVATTLDPATLGTLSNAAAALGDTASANEYAHVLDVAVLKQPGAYHRAWSLFLLDHHRHVDVVSSKIRQELRTRQDVYAYDLLAWSLHVQGRDKEASVAMARALREGTHDAQLDVHAAAINAAMEQRMAAGATGAASR